MSCTSSLEAGMFYMAAFNDVHYLPNRSYDSSKSMNTLELCTSTLLNSRETFLVNLQISLNISSAPMDPCDAVKELPSTDILPAHTFKITNTNS